MITLCILIIKVLITVSLDTINNEYEYFNKYLNENLITAKLYVYVIASVFCFSC